MDEITWYQVGIATGTDIDGAVAELCAAPDGTITAEVRIPGPQPGGEPVP